MRVLHLLDHSLPILSGYSVRTHQILRTQRARGMAPLALTSRKQGCAAEITEIDGVKYFRSPARAAPDAYCLPLVTELALIWDLTRSLERMLREHRIELVHAHSPFLSAVAALWGARRAGIPVVYEMRALWEDAAVETGRGTLGSTRYGLSRRLETAALRRVDAVGVISGGLAGEVSRRGVGRDRIFLVPNGVDTEYYRPRRADAEIVGRMNLAGCLVVGFIGGLQRFEGLEVFLRAFAGVMLDIPTARALVVGSGDEGVRLRQLAQRLGVESGVIFTGHVPHEETGRYYSVCDVVVYPRLRSRLTELVTPLKPLEAMGMAKPVVASDVGGLREIVRDGETGVLVPAGDVSALRVSLRELLHDPPRRKALGERARSFVCEHRQWETVLAEGEATYTNLLESFARAPRQQRRRWGLAAAR